MKKILPESFDALAYVETMQPYIGIAMDAQTREEVSKLMTVAHNMAAIVYSAPVDENETDFANTFIPGKQS